MGDTIGRDELYEAVWTAPATKVAARYGITSVALAKICRKLRVPTPPRGYWARIAAGQAVERAPLPKAIAGQPQAHTLGTAANAGGVPTTPAVAAERARARVVVPETIAELHPLVAKHEPRLRRRGEANDIWAKSSCIAVQVSRAQLDRALRIMSALLLALDERGVTVEVTAPRAPGGGRAPRSRTIVTVEGVALELLLAEERRWESPMPPQPPPEPTRRKHSDPRVDEIVDRLVAGVERDRLRREYPPVEVWTGELRLAIQFEGYHRWSAQRQVRDTGRKRVEDRLNEFIRQLYVVADLVRKEADLRERERLEREARERAWKAQERAKQRQKALCEDLERRMNSLRYADEIRALAASVESASPPSGSASAWLDWARAYADHLECSALNVAKIWESA